MNCPVTTYHFITFIALSTVLSLAHLPIAQSDAGPGQSISGPAICDVGNVFPIKVLAEHDAGWNAGRGPLNPAPNA